MARLPIPGADDGTWGDVLNDYLSASHNTDGTLKTGVVDSTALSTNTIATAHLQDDAVSNAKLQDNSVNIDKLSASGATNGQLLSFDGVDLAWTNPSAGGDPALGGVLSGTASTAQIKTGVVGATQLASNSVTTLKVADANITTAKLADNSVTALKLADNAVDTAAVTDGAVTEAKLAPAVQTKINAVSNSITVAAEGTNVATEPRLNFIEGTNVTISAVDDTVNNKVDISISATGSGGAADASTTSKGIVQLAGDLTGSAVAPAIATGAVSTAKLADNSVTTAKVADGNITTGKLANSSVTNAKLADSSVDAPQIMTSLAPTAGQVLGYDGASLTWTAAGTSNPTVGGDLSGTASNAQIVAGAVGATELATNAVTTAKINASAVTQPKISTTNAPGANQVLSYDGSAMVWVAQTGGAVDATTTSKGVIQLAGDLGGTATVPTVPGLASKAADSAVVHNTGAETVAGVKTFSSSPIVPTPTTGTQATNKSYVDGLVPAGATTGATGVVQLAGDLAGTATSPSVAKIKGVTLPASGPTAAGQVLTTTSTTATAWSTPSASSGGRFNIAAVSANYSAADYDFVIANAVSAGFTVTLPAPVTGGWVRVKKIDSTTNAIIVMRTGIQIDDQVSISINSQWQSQDFASDGTKWFRI
jgi:hypothetical protein